MNPCPLETGLPRVKVCGLTRREDALAAAACGADALGFVFAPRSKRRADPYSVAGIIAELPPFVTTVGVFQDQPLDEVCRIRDACGLAMVQLHGAEDLDYIRELASPVLKGIGLARREDVQLLAAFPGVAGFLLDASFQGVTGGTGMTFDWTWAEAAKSFGPLVLAGGLTPENVAAAVRAVRPWAVDAASGTEQRPGIKDHRKLEQFVNNAKLALAPTAPQDG